MNDISSTQDAGSFRDPSGIIFYRNNKVLRQINPCYKEQYLNLKNSGLFDELHRKKLLVRHSESDEAGITGDSYIVIEPERIPLISYPFEWCFDQLKDAALLTLKIHRLALDHDMILKDASAYNIQFIRGSAILIDTLSFEFYREGEPWVAYGQFCRHFLAPLFLMSFVDVRLAQLFRSYIDGIPIDLASKLLKGKGGFAAKTHIHWHAKSIEKHSQAGQPDQKTVRRIPISKFKMKALIDSLIKTVEKLDLRSFKSEWGEYYCNTNYSDGAAKSKQQIVTGYLETLKPSVTWDLGANDGTYSRLAAAKDSEQFAVAFDIDPVAVGHNYKTIKNSKENILPLLLDLSNPSPAFGFAGNERKTLPERQRPDCIMMLAVVHHLAISNNIPLKLLAGWLAPICEGLIIEFVPKSDSQVRVLLATRDDIFTEYTPEGFEKAFSFYFDIIKKTTVTDSERVIYLMKPKQSG